MSSRRGTHRMKPRFTNPFVIAVLSAAAAAAVTALLINIFTRQQEARDPFFRVVELNDETVDPAVWGKNFHCNMTAIDGLSIRCARVTAAAKRCRARPPRPTRAASSRNHVSRRIHG